MAALRSNCGGVPYAMDATSPAVTDDGGGAGGPFCCRGDDAATLASDMSSGFSCNGNEEGRPSSEMTWSRRLARRLARHRWYNPRGYGLEGSSIDANYYRAHDDGASGSSKGRSSRPSLDAAWAHYERVTLPNDPHSHRLYDVWNTPLRELVRFGASTQMFLSTLLVFSAILFVAGVLNVPLMIYFYNYADANGGKGGVDYLGVGRSIRASALCDATIWVECPSCHYEENIAEYPSYRLREVDYGNGNVLYQVRRNACDFDNFLIPGVLSYAASVLVLLLAAFFLFKQTRAEVVIDESVQTTSDYSIEVSNPPKDAFDPEEWKAYFDQFVDANENRTVPVRESVEVDKDDPFGPRTCCSARKRGGGVVLVTIALNNGDLIRALIKRRTKLELLNKLLSKFSRELPDGGSYEVEIDNLTEMESIETIVNEASAAIHAHSSSIYMKCHRLLSRKLDLIPANDPRVLWEELLGIENDIRNLVHNKQYGAVSVFVTFDSERSQRNALHALSTSKLDVWYNNRSQGVLDQGGKLHVTESVQSSNLWACTEPPERELAVQLSQAARGRRASLEKHLLMFRGVKVLQIAEAAEPSDVRWVDLQSSARRRFELHLASALGMATFVCGSGYFIYRLTTNYPGSYAAMFITLTNAIVPKACELISDMESHPTEHGKQLSLFVKITLFRWFNSAIALYLISSFIETISVEDGEELNMQSMMYKVYPVIVAELFCNPLIDVLDVPENVRKHFLAPRAADQAEMNACFSGTRWWLAERYTNALRVIFVALFFASVLPEALLLGSMALLAQYHVGKFMLLRLCGPPPDVGFHLARFGRKYFLPAILLTHVCISGYWWSGYPYDQVLYNDESGEFVSCNQNFFKSRTFPPLPRFQPEGARWMTEGQETLTSLYGWTSVLAILIASFNFLWVNIIPWTRSLYESTYEPDGADQGIPFSDVMHRKEVDAYVPQATVKGFTFPLLACDIRGIDEDLIRWKDDERGYEPHNLLRDVEAIVKAESLPRPVVSIVRQWK